MMMMMQSSAAHLALLAPLFTFLFCYAAMLGARDGPAGHVFLRTAMHFRCGCPVLSMRGEALHCVGYTVCLSIRACNKTLFFFLLIQALLLFNPLTHLYVVGCWVCLFVIS